VALQLGHAGRKGATRLMWEGMDRPLPPEQRWPTLSASAIPYFPDSPVPRAMTRADMDAVKADFVPPRGARSAAASTCWSCTAPTATCWRASCPR
jgi:anthraniloyl-CoA monooxygenase